MDKKNFGKKREFAKPATSFGKKREFSKDFKKPTFARKPKVGKFVKSERPVKENNDNDDEEEFNLQLVGRNAVLEAIENGSHIDRILIKKGEGEGGRLEGSLKVIYAKAKERGIVTQEVAKEKLDMMCQLEGEKNNHQGVIALCPAFAYSEISEIIALAKEKEEDPLIIVLDEISDPHNLGAIIRTADACGAHGVIIPKRRACGLTATVVRTSAGAAAYVKVARVTNIVNAIDELKKNNIWVACSDMDGDSLYKAPLTGALAIVVGGEGEGVGPLIKKHCDFTVQIPMKGKISSLNASVAAAVVMYEVVRRKADK